MTSTALTPAPRDWKSAVARGALGRCPACGKGALFNRYLKVNDACATCGEELHHQRADDAPPYATMFIVGHIVVGGLLAVETWTQDVPMWAHMLLWPLLAAALSLLLLPIVKGALINLQWALRMHGFSTAPDQVSRKGWE